MINFILFLLLSFNTTAFRFRAKEARPRSVKNVCSRGNHGVRVVFVKERENSTMEPCCPFITVTGTNGKETFEFMRGSLRKEAAAESVCNNGCVYRKISPLEEGNEYCFKNSFSDPYVDASCEANLNTNVPTQCCQKMTVSRNGSEETYSYWSGNPMNEDVRNSVCEDGCIYKRVDQYEEDDEFCFGKSEDDVEVSSTCLAESRLFFEAPYLSTCMPTVKIKRNNVEEKYSYKRSNSMKDEMLNPNCINGCIYKKTDPLEELNEYCLRSSDEIIESLHERILPVNSPCSLIVKVKKDENEEIFTYIRGDPDNNEADPNCQDGCIYTKTHPPEVESEYCFRKDELSEHETTFYEPLSSESVSCPPIVNTIHGNVEETFTHIRGSSGMEESPDPNCKDGCIYRKTEPLEETNEYCFTKSDLQNEAPCRKQSPNNMQSFLGTK